MVTITQIKYTDEKNNTVGFDCKVIGLSELPEIFKGCLISDPNSAGQVVLENWETGKTKLTLVNVPVVIRYTFK